MPLPATLPPDPPKEPPQVTPPARQAPYLNLHLLPALQGAQRLVHHGDQRFVQALEEQAVLPRLLGHAVAQDDEGVRGGHGAQVAPRLLPEGSQAGMHHLGAQALLVLALGLVQGLQAAGQGVSSRRGERRQQGKHLQPCTLWCWRTTSCKALCKALCKVLCKACSGRGRLSEVMPRGFGLAEHHLGGVQVLLVFALGLVQDQVCPGFVEETGACRRSLARYAVP